VLSIDYNNYTGPQLSNSVKGTCTVTGTYIKKLDPHWTFIYNVTDAENLLKTTRVIYVVWNSKVDLLFNFIALTTNSYGLTSRTHSYFLY